MSAWRVLAALIVAGVPFQPATGQTSGLADRLIDAYSSLESYCDRSRQVGNVPSNRMQCVLADGRHKSVLGNASNGQSFEVTWGDTDFRYYYFSNAPYRPQSYGKSRFIARDAYGDIPPLASIVLGSYWLVANDMALLRRRLDDFELRPELSTDDLQGYESNEPDARARQRIWISRADGLIRRVGWANEDVDHLEVDEVRVNAALTEAELTYDAPASARGKRVIRTNAVYIAIALCVASFLCGLAYWRARGRTSRNDADASTAGARICSQYWKTALLTFPPGLLYALFAPTGGDMSGAAWMFERIGWALFYGYLLWLGALFIAARHFVGRPSS